MPVITEETPLQVVLDTVPTALIILSRHGCDVLDECPELIRDMPLQECEYVCHLDDMAGLLAALNGALAA